MFEFSNYIMKKKKNINLFFSMKFHRKGYLLLKKKKKKCDFENGMKVLLIWESKIWI